MRNRKGGKKPQQARKSTASDEAGAGASWKRFAAPAAMALMLASAAFIYFRGWERFSYGNSAPASGGTNLTRAAAGTNTGEMGVSGEPIRMTVAQAVVVTEELDFGGRIPSLAEAVGQIERAYQPDDGQGRTFAILDARGETTPEGRLKISMHVSSEKPGMAFLRFRPTGRLFWRARIGSPGEPPAGPKNLVIHLSNGSGGNFVLDGKRGGASVLDVFIQGSTSRARDVWPDGTEREVTFIYSACGCPVKVMVRREGDRTARTRLSPVIFPDDPDVVATISALMKW
ncbi:MAG: hypothetical protein ACKVX9_21955 [Blastocatellia bacterium]